MESKKICKNEFLGLIDGHRWFSDRREEKRVCAKCGLYEKIDYTYDEYADSYWNTSGVVDDPSKLIEKWRLIIREYKQDKKQDEVQAKQAKQYKNNYRKVKWEDA